MLARVRVRDRNSKKGTRADACAHRVDLVGMRPLLKSVYDCMCASISGVRTWARGDEGALARAAARHRVTTKLREK